MSNALAKLPKHTLRSTMKTVTLKLAKHELKAKTEAIMQK